jgi:16S rRNA (uracil1498-N3)-methyltransferase
MPRIYCPTPLTSDQAIELPAGAARHVQVLRLQPGDGVTLFDGTAGEYEAAITHMGRSSVSVQVGAHAAVEREAGREIHLALGIPANERMDWLVEKATELGVTSIQPLLAERSVLRVSGERAEKKREHWQAIAIAACEQCGRNRVPMLHPIAALKDWLRTAPADGQRLLLSLRPETRLLREVAASGPLLFLSGPEGGLSPVEEDAALAVGFTPVTLGARTLRAETAPLAALAALTLGTCS